ncbi:MAG: KamA family radical SAM protein [Deltaproteobacteria bacterium]|nr:KamA family radical SAM protein [Deltaproteobacteria bacterium]
MNFNKRKVDLKNWGAISAADWKNWEWQAKNRIRTLPKLAGYFGLSSETVQPLKTVAGVYHFSMTPYYLSLINKEDESDPIRRQCFPDIKEVQFTIDGVPDPLEEEACMPVPGLVHRYADRCLAIATNRCVTYCRHCNRKRMWGKNLPTRQKDYLKRMVDYVASSPVIREVIVSGGDPLTLNESLLDWFLGSLRSIRHVDVLRIGSRMPVVMPMRITHDLCRMLRSNRPLWFNTQFNHPRELTMESARACDMLLEAGIPVSNQSVLLKGVNDDYEVMRDLVYGLQRLSVRPYYLFQCDPVAGTDHFRCDILKGMAIIEKLWLNVSGLCLPRYVIDSPGRGGKIPIQPFSLLADRSQAH